MINTMQSKAKNNEKSKKRCENGFTLIELLVGAAMAGIIATAGISLSSHIHRTTKDDISAMRGISRTDSVLDMLNEEISLSKTIITRASDLPAGCSSGGGRFFLAFQLPPQAYGKGDYASITNSKGQVITKAQSNNAICPTVIGLKASASDEIGPLSLYRYGPQVDANGYYVDTKKLPMNLATLLDGVTSQPKGIRKSCASGWSYMQSSGVEACIDKYKRSALLSVSRQAAKNSRSIKRSAASGSNVLDEKLVPSMFKGNAGGVNGITTIGGQQVQCDGTTFLIDVSGSMSSGRCQYKRIRYRRWGRWYYGWRWVCSGKSRMDKAKAELLNAIKKCPDGARINVYSFNSYYRQFRPAVFGLDTNSRNSVNNWIGQMRAGGGTNPWPSMNKLMQDRTTKTVVALTDGGTWQYGTCFHNGRRMKYADCYAQYNNTTRQADPVEVRGIVVDADCNRGYASWMGELSQKTGGTCVRTNL